jgi:hypothetical protein
MPVDPLADRLDPDHHSLKWEKPMRKICTTAAIVAIVFTP